MDVRESLAQPLDSGVVHAGLDVPDANRLIVVLPDQALAGVERSARRHRELATAEREPCSKRKAAAGAAAAARADATLSTLARAEGRARAAATR
jgi:hypothetical protein